MNDKIKKVCEVFNLPIQVSVGGGFLEDNDYKLLENLQVVANCVNHHDALIGERNKLQQENDELKAMVNELHHVLICVAPSSNTWAMKALNKVPKQCLLEHDKRVLNDYAAFQHGCYIKGHGDVSTVTDYIDQLGGDK